METFPQLEETSIKRVRENNNMTKQLEDDAGLYNYHLGDILYVCLDKNKTKNKFDKKRRNFEYLGSFINYVNGNFIINLLSKSFISLGTIIVPIYFTKFCSHNIMSIPDNVFTVQEYKKPKKNRYEEEYGVDFNDIESERVIE
jgi:hypothetical protein